MPKLVPIEPKVLINILKSLGFVHLRTRGSHHFFTHPDGRTTVVPVHSNEQVSGGLLLKIFRDIKVSKEQFEFLRLQ